MDNSSEPKVGKPGNRGGVVSQGAMIKAIDHQTELQFRKYFTRMAQSAIDSAKLSGKISKLDFIKHCVEVEKAGYENGHKVIFAKADELKVEREALRKAVNQYLSKTRAVEKPAESKPAVQKTEKSSPPARSANFPRREQPWVSELSAIIDQAGASRPEPLKVHYDSAGQPVTPGRKTRRDK